MDTKKVKFKINKENVELICEVAKTITEKLNGLMYKETLDEDKGMLFSFTFPWYRFFWMKDVKIPLDIIFVNSKNKIIKIYEAPVEKGFFYKNYSSWRLCKYVVETNMGFCRKNNIKKNDSIEIL